jgi:cation transport regulator ChaC
MMSELDVGEQAGSSQPILYFAYGSMMLRSEIEGVCGSEVRVVGAGSADGFRLKFTRGSEKWGGGVADIVSAVGYRVWGVIFEVPQDMLGKLDEREGVPRGAYKRLQLRVRTSDGKEFDAQAYDVVDKSAQEIAPSERYFDTLAAGAKAGGLPQHYMRFMSHLRWHMSNHAGAVHAQAQSQSRESGNWHRKRPRTRRRYGSFFRQGFQLRGSTATPARRGGPIVQVHPSRCGGIRDWHALCFESAVALVDVVPTEEVPHDEIWVDQVIREGLGVRYAREHFGFSCSLVYLGGPPRFPRILIRPRVIALSVAYQSYMDTGLDIAVLHPRQIELLGLTPGQHITVMAAAKSSKADGDFLYYQSLTLRCFAGTSSEIRSGNSFVPYPQIGRLHLSAETRKELGARIKYVVLVQANVARAFASRLLLYGSSFFVALLSLHPISVELAGILGIGSRAVLITLTVALVLSTVLSWIDLRSRLQI